MMTKWINIVPLHEVDAEFSSVAQRPPSLLSVRFPPSVSGLAAWLLLPGTQEACGPVPSCSAAPLWWPELGQSLAEPLPTGHSLSSSEEPALDLELAWASLGVMDTTCFILAWG